MPALFTSPLSAPSASAAATARAQSASSVTSSLRKCAAGPSSRARASPSASSTSPRITLAPSATSKRASAAPWPRAPPEIRITLPSKRAMICHLVCRWHHGIRPAPWKAELRLSRAQAETARCKGLAIGNSSPTASRMKDPQVAPIPLPHSPLLRCAPKAPTPGD